MFFVSTSFLLFGQNTSSYSQEGAGFASSRSIPQQNFQSAASSGQNLSPAVSGIQNQMNNAEYDPKVSATKIYHEGAETLGRVGGEAILKRDIIHQIRKYAQLHWTQEMKKMSPEEKEKNGEMIRQEIIKGYLSNQKSYSDLLDGYIRKLLYYNDFIVSRPKEQVADQKKKLEEVFEKEYVPELCKQFGCKSTQELRDYFKDQINSTLAEEKRLFIQETIGSSWLEYNLGTETDEPTVVELRRYYETHLDQYKQEERVRWLSMSVMFSNHQTEQEAYEKIARMGNYVLEASTAGQQNQRFQEIARKESEDFFASKGGSRDWTKRGALNSKIIEEALFSEDLPVGKLSRIIRDSSCFTIICVIQREGKTWRPFIDVQEEVKKKFVQEKRKYLQNKYEDALSKRFTIELYNIGEEERRQRVENFFRETKSASGRNITENMLR